MSDPLILGYWHIRGRGQPIRHLLAYSGLKFQEKAYLDFQSYFGEKADLGLDFPNLPYIIDGDIKISETYAVAKHVVRRSGKTDLLGKNIQDEGTIDQLFYMVWENMVIKLVGLLFNKKVLDVKPAHYYKNKALYDKFEKHLAGKQFALGYLTIIDFFIAEGTWYLEKLFPEEYKNYPNHHRIREKIQNLPQVLQYYKRQKSIRTPFLAPSLTAIPFYYPGTEPKQPPPPPVLSPTKSKVSSKESQLYKPENPIKVLIIPGTIEENTPLRNLIKSLVFMKHPAFNFSRANISNLQLHCETYENEGTDSVNNLRKQVQEADGLLIGVLETHNNVSVGLLNAYNWIAPQLKNKPIGLVSMNSSEEKFRGTLDAEGIKYYRGGQLKVKEKQFYNGQCQIVGEENVKRARQFLNGLAEYMEKRG